MALSAVSCLAAVIICAGSAGAETVFLKDGSIIEGRIISDAAGAVTVRDKDNKTRTVQRGNIMRILYTELFMGKVYVQKTDGKNVICYMVDEDRESYTFRKELFSPEEFKLKRDQVMFMARGNPSGLEGEADTDRVELKWFPPYNQVKRYHIYIKAPDDKTFRLADETKRKSVTIKDLKSNTKYLLHVTAVDNAGDESLPSNELVLITKNIKPDKPEKINFTRKYSADGKKYTAELTWSTASDPDGRVKGYNVYKRDDGRDILLGKITSAAYSVKDLVAGEEYQFKVKSIDDKEEESEDPAVLMIREQPFISFELNGYYIITNGRLGEMLDYGYGGFLSVYMTNIYFAGFDTGFSSGYWMFEGEHSRVNSAFMVPMLLTLRYRLPVMWGIYLSPAIHGGFFYNSIDYSYIDQASSEEKEATDTSFEPAVLGGGCIGYGVTDVLHFTAGAYYGVIFEQDRRLEMTAFSAGLSLMF